LLLSRKGPREARIIQSNVRNNESADEKGVCAIDWRVTESVASELLYQSKYKIELYETNLIASGRSFADVMSLAKCHIFVLNDSCVSE